jgi:exo-beta-1,3-glucanase (GH17 family)
MDHELLTTIFAGVGAVSVVLIGLVALMRGGQLAGQVIERMDTIRTRLEKLCIDLRVMSKDNHDAHQEIRETIGETRERVAKVEQNVDTLCK